MGGGADGGSNSCALFACPMSFAICGAPLYSQAYNAQLWSSFSKTWGARFPESRIANRTIPRIAGQESPEIPQRETKKSQIAMNGITEN